MSKHPESPVMDAGALVVMGVSGCGKSTVGRACADLLDWSFVEGDDFHSPASVEKMAAGIALTDADREGWLARLADILRSSRGRGLVLPCSALRKVYRDELRAASPGLRFVYLELSEDEAVRRVTRRRGHFFAPRLVHSQFATLESPVGEAGVLTVDGSLPVDALARHIAEWINAT